jgi:hypothetical protein
MNKNRGINKPRVKRDGKYNNIMTPRQVRETNRPDRRSQD